MIGRIVLWDLFRILQIFSIVHFHLLEAFISSDIEYPPYLQSYLYLAVASCVRVFSTGGLNLVALSLFIIGYKRINLKKLKFLSVVLFLGILILNLGYSFGFAQNLYFEWDIYHYLLVTIAFIYVLDRYSRKYSGAVLLCSFFLCLFPWWTLSFPFNHKIAHQALIGDCSSVTTGTWAILPWLFWASFFWSFGAIIKDRYLDCVKNLNIFKVGVLGLFSILLYGLASSSYFFHVPVGNTFSCYVHRPEFISFFAHFISLILLLGVSVNRSLNELLKRYFSWTAFFYWNQKLGVTYLFHILFLTLSLYIFDLKIFTGLQFIFFVVFQFMSADLASRLFFKFYQKGLKVA